MGQKVHPSWSSSPFPAAGPSFPHRAVKTSFLFVFRKLLYCYLLQLPKSATRDFKAKPPNPEPITAQHFPRKMTTHDSKIIGSLTFSSKCQNDENLSADEIWDLPKPRGQIYRGKEKDDIGVLNLQKEKERPCARKGCQIQLSLFFFPSFFSFLFKFLFFFLFGLFSPTHLVSNMCIWEKEKRKVFGKWKK